MALTDIFGSNKRDAATEKQELIDCINQNFNSVLENQAKLMKRLLKLEKLVSALETKLDELQAPQPAAAVQEAAYPTLNEPVAENAQASACYSRPAQPQQPAEPAPSPFYANIDGDALVPVEDEYKANAHVFVEPISLDAAIVSFNDLCASTYLSWGPSSLENSFDCVIVNKNPSSIIATNTSTAHLSGGTLILDAPIQIKFV